LYSGVRGADHGQGRLTWMTTTTKTAADTNAAAGILAGGGVYDPNGNVIELLELAPGLVTSRAREVHGTDQ
jgi:hypothetical protein